MPMAKSHSKTDEKWIAHVGIDSAFAGSAATLSVSSGLLSKLPSPKRKAECCSKPAEGPMAVAAPAPKGDHTHHTIM